MRREISRPAVTPRQPRRRSALVVLVVAAPPDARLVAPPGGAVEPLVHAPEGVQSARVGGIGVVDRGRSHTTSPFRIVISAPSRLLPGRVPAFTAKTRRTLRNLPGHCRDGPAG